MHVMAIKSSQQHEVPGRIATSEVSTNEELMCIAYIQARYCEVLAPS
jgi:hypothetical protein